MLHWPDPNLGLPDSDAAASLGLSPWLRTANTRDWKVGVSSKLSSRAMGDGPQLNNITDFRTLQTRTCDRSGGNRKLHLRGQENA